MSLAGGGSASPKGVQGVSPHRPASLLKLDRKRVLCVEQVKNHSQGILSILQTTAKMIYKHLLWWLFNWMLIWDLMTCCNSWSLSYEGVVEIRWSCVFKKHHFFSGCFCASTHQISGPFRNSESTIEWEEHNVFITCASLKDTIGWDASKTHVLKSCRVKCLFFCKLLCSVSLFWCVTSHSKSRQST